MCGVLYTFLKQTTEGDLMRTHAPWGKTSLVAAIVAAGILLAGTPVFAEETDASMGTTQGKADARANGWWFLSGLLLPGVGIILPWLFAPSVPSDNLIGKSEEYVASYQKAFVSKVKLGNFLWSVAG